MTFAEREEKEREKLKELGKNKKTKKSPVESMIQDNLNPDREIEKISIMRKEKRSKQYSFTMQPSVYKIVQRKCKDENISISELLNQFLIKVAEKDIELSLENM